MAARASTTLMTEGKISSRLIGFAMPIFLGNLFQQLYNSVDAIVVGNFESMEALSAITSTGSLSFLIVGFFGGCFQGCSVITARYFGAEDYGKVQKSVHTTVGFALICGIIMTLLGTTTTPFLLKLMKTPAETIGMATTYMRIYFGGILAIALYNTASGIFQAVGDSRTPLVCLIISSCTNIVLDIVFVATFGWGVAGAAAATVISQFLSVIIAFSKLMKTDGVHKVSLRRVHIEKSILKEDIKVGVPSGIQNAVISIANVLIQTNVNLFGAAAAAGYGAAAKLEGFVFIPITSLAMSLTTFTGQNLGARDYGRAKKGAAFGLIVGMLLSEFIGVLMFLFAPQVIRVFTSDAAAIAIGARKNKITSLFYFGLSASHIFAGILRGAGKSKVPMFVMLSIWCIFRCAYVTVATKLIPGVIDVVFWAYPITWTLSLVLFIIYFVKSDWLHAFD